MADAVTDQARFRPKGRVVLRRVGEDRLLVPVSSMREHQNRIFPVNEVGEVIWQHVSTGKSIAETATEMTQSFEVELEDVKKDCCQFVLELCEAKLLEPME